MRYDEIVDIYIQVDNGQGGWTDALYMPDVPCKWIGFKSSTVFMMGSITTGQHPMKIYCNADIDLESSIMTVKRRKDGKMYTASNSQRLGRKTVIGVVI